MKIDPRPGAPTVLTDPFVPRWKTLPNLPRSSSEVPIDGAAQQRFVAADRSGQPSAGALKGYEAHRMMTDAEHDRALTALLAESTDNSAKTPANQLLAAMRGTPSLDAALEYLAQLFTPAAHRDVLSAADQATLIAKAGTVIASHGDDGRDAFIGRILFNLSHPADYRYLEGVIKAVVPADRLVHEVVRRIGRGSSLHARNASEMVYQIIGYSGVPLTTEQRSELELARLVRMRDPNLNQVAQMALDAMRVPASR